jgi:uracil-DNA glycosylase
MSDTKPTTYLEDVEVSATTKAAEVPTTTAKPVDASTTAVKRQRNLLDMFVSQEKGPADKKQKLSASSSSAVVLPNKDISKASLDAQALNSIPFSMSSFIESLPEEHRKLLKLECDVMGKSWHVHLTYDQIQVFDVSQAKITQRRNKEAVFHCPEKVSMGRGRKKCG